MKHCGLALPDPVKTSQSNLEASKLLTGHLISALRGDTDYNSAEHTKTCKSVRARLKTEKIKSNDKALDEILQALPPDLQRTLSRGKKTGQFLSVQPSHTHGTILAPLEFRDALHIRLGTTPPDLPHQCDGCNADFSVPHALSCRRGGLVITRHNEIHDELADIAEKAFCASAIRNEPKIHLGCDNEAKNANKSDNTTAVKKNLCKTTGDERGDLLIRSLWSNSTDCIIDVRITDTDQKTYKDKDPLKVLEQHEREKKRKYLQPCLDQRRNFTPFVVSTDGLLGKEASTLIKNLAGRIATKSGGHYSHICGALKARMSLAIVRATHLCLRGSRVPTSQMSNRRPQWEDGTGLASFRY